MTPMLWLVASLLTSQGHLVRVQAAPPPPPPVSPALCRVSMRVEVFWNDRWYPAIVTGEPVKGLCPITYEGYDSSWDERVPSTRIRPRA